MGFEHPKANYNKKPNAHPTQKPEQVARWLLNLFAKDGDLIFDPFAGSGSFLVACKQKGFKFVGCEINKDYVEIIKKRLAQGTVADFTQPNGCPDGSFNKDLTGLSADKPQIEPNGPTSLNPDIMPNFYFGSSAWRNKWK